MVSSTSYWLWVGAMTLALFYPVSRLIWVVSVRRLQRKLKTVLTEEEIQGQKKRAYFIGIILSLVFSLLFNFRILN